MNKKSLVLLLATVVAERAAHDPTGCQPRLRLGAQVGDAGVGVIRADRRDVLRVRGEVQRARRHVHGVAAELFVRRVRRMREKGQRENRRVATRAETTEAKKKKPTSDASRRFRES